MHQREKPPAVATPAALDLRVISGRTDDAENSKNDVDKQGGNDGAIAFSNSLPELAARIRAEHTAVSLALRESLGHSIAAGELLIEPKELGPNAQCVADLSLNEAAALPRSQNKRRCRKGGAQ